MRPVMEGPGPTGPDLSLPEGGDRHRGRNRLPHQQVGCDPLIHAYARRPPHGVDIVAYDPGVVPGTGLSREAATAVQFAMRTITPLTALTPRASTQQEAGQRLADVVLGLTPASSGSYVDRTRETRSSAESYVPDREERLWTAVEELTSVFTT